LDELYLYRNDLIGSIPPALADLPALTVLDVDENSLTGTFPNEIFNIPTLRGIFASFNTDLRGVFPETIGAKNLEVSILKGTYVDLEIKEGHCLKSEAHFHVFL
jgi:Leucine-rich repeat (LRR) protein